MTKRLKKFIERIVNSILTTAFGGLVIVLPITILFSGFLWAFKTLRGIISPFTKVIEAATPLGGLVADGIAIVIITGMCFIIGQIVKSTIGHNWFSYLEGKLFHKLPLYKMIKETVNQFFGKDKKSPFSRVALAQIFENNTMVTCFVTDEYTFPHGDKPDTITVFVPTGPNPTSGNIYHLRPENVHTINTPVDMAMKSIISCGAGSAELIRSFHIKKEVST